MSEWISVKDRLPIVQEDMNGEAYMDVNILVSVEGVTEPEIFQAGITPNFWSCFEIYDSATHWMPLPPPPKELDK